MKIARKTIDWTKNPYREPERGVVSETEIGLISGSSIHRMGLAVGWLVGVALATVAAAFVLVSIQSVWNWGFLPTLAEINAGMLSYYVVEMFKVLDQAGAPDEQIAGPEWAYLPFFQFADRPPRKLHKALGTEPGFFIEVLRQVYRPSPESGVQ